jgi:hypothetical protein
MSNNEERQGLAQRYTQPFGNYHEDVADYDETETETVDEDFDEFDDLPPELVKAIKLHRGSKHNKPIVLGKNRSPIRTSDGRHWVNRSHRRFTAIANGSAFNKLANEKYVDSLDNDQFFALCESVMDEDDDGGQLAVTIRGSALKKAAKRRAEMFEDIETAEWLDNIRERIEEAKTTAAARTLQTHRVDEPSVRDQLPDSFKQSGLLPAQAQPNFDNTTAATTKLPTDNDVAIRVKDYDTRASLPKEFASIDKYEDQSFVAQAGRMKNPTKAAASRERPIASKDVGHGNDDQNNVSYLTPNRTPAVKDQTQDYVFPVGSKNGKCPNIQPQYVADLAHLASPRPDGT